MADEQEPIDETVEQPPLEGPAFTDSSRTLSATAETMDSGSPKAEPGDSPLPEIRGYTIESAIASGGMGTVYLATQTPPGRKVALKVVRLSGQLVEKALRFQQEVKASAKLDHPNIVTVYEVGAVGTELLWYSMQLVVGETLQDAITDRRLGLRDTLKIVQRLAEALHVAHGAGILHRDIKPENILIDRAGTPFITDFGLARDTSQDARVTTTGTIAGTPLYMSPEQAQGERYLDHRTDIYSLGASLYEMLVYRPAFQAASVVSVLAKIMTEEPPRLRSLDPRLPVDVATICEKAMRKDRNDRYTDAGAFAADLGRYLDGLPIQARPVPPHRRAWLWVRRNPVVAALIVTVVVGGLGFGGWLLLERSREIAFQEQRLEVARGHWEEGERAFAAAADRRKAGEPAQAMARAEDAERSYLLALEQLSQAQGLGHEPLALRAVIRKRLLERAEAEGDRRLAAILLADLRDAVAVLDPGPERQELARFAAGRGRIALRAGGTPGLTVKVVAAPKGAPEPRPEGDGFAFPRAPMGSYTLLLQAPGREDLTLPVWLARCEELELEVSLLEEGALPAGMVYVPAGPYFKGGNDPGDRASVRTQLSGFLIDTGEVTYADYRAFLSTLSPEEAKGRAPATPGADDLPVVGITWEDAAAYAAAQGKRLPTEDEWTKAARGADPRPYAFGQRFDPARTNVARAQEGARPAGSFPDLSPYGCRDMAGNVSEFVSDLYWPEQPQGPRVRRGGAWALAPHYARVTYRDPIAPSERRRYLGFRCARDLPD